jgi:hypothetical protein
MRAPRDAHRRGQGCSRTLPGVPRGKSTRRGGASATATRLHRSLSVLDGLSVSPGPGGFLTRGADTHAHVHGVPRLRPSTSIVRFEDGSFRFPSPPAELLALRGASGPQGSVGTSRDLGPACAASRLPRNPRSCRAPDAAARRLRQWGDGRCSRRRPGSSDKRSGPRLAEVYLWTWAAATRRRRG